MSFWPLHASRESMPDFPAHQHTCHDSSIFKQTYGSFICWRQSTSYSEHTINEIAYNWEYCVVGIRWPWKHSHLKTVSKLGLLCRWDSELYRMGFIRFLLNDSVQTADYSLCICSLCSAYGDFDPIQPRRVVVTGLGLVTPLGIDVENTWQRLLKGDCAIRKLVKEDLPKVFHSFFLSFFLSFCIPLQSHHPQSKEAWP